MLHSLKTYNSPGCISDLSLQGVVPEEEQRWFLNTVIPEAVRCGLKRIAAIGFLDIIRRNYYEGLRGKAQAFGLELQIFDQIDGAVNWMETFIKIRVED